MTQHLGRNGLAFLAALTISVLAGCGAYQPGTPGHEPPVSSRTNPASGETNASPQ